MINEEFIAHFVQKAAETIAPWLVFAVVVLLILWLVLLCRQTRPFAKPFAQFIGLSPFGKFIVITAVCLCTLFGGSKEGGNHGGGGSGALGDRALSGGSGGLRGLPPELAAESNLLSITAFEIDPIGGAVGFGIVCASNLFGYTASRDLYLFSSTNLSERRWTPLGAFPMPEGTSACAFTVTTNDVDLSARPFFLDSLDGIGFYRFGADFDSDGDGLIDIYEALWTLTDPGNPDSDGDWMPDGDELALGTDPLSADTDLDGIPDYVETGGIAIDSHLQPFFEGAVLTNLTAAILADTNRCVDVDLPDPAPLLDETFSRLSIDKNGIVCLRKAGATSPIYARPYNDDVVHASFPTGTFAVAAYWTRLSLSTNAPASSIELKSDGSFIWVEYSNMRLADSTSPEENLVSFQVVMPNDDFPYVSLLYRTGGTYSDGRLASIGACGRNGAFRKSFCYMEQGRIADGMMLYVDLGYGTDPLSADTDLDGLPDGAEVNTYGTDPIIPDTDRDGMLDGWEVANSLNPLSASGDDGANGDPDLDGLANINEYLNNCNPQIRDSDGDGAWDLNEIEGNSDPADINDGGVAQPTNLFRTLIFNIDGDYAAWEMTIEGIGPLDMRIHRISMGYPHAEQNVPVRLRKGGKYRLSMHWLNSDGHNNPDWYCWQAKVDGLPAETTYNSYSTERKSGIAEIVRGDGWVADNADGLLSGHVHERQGHGGNVAGHLTATLYVLDVDISICAPSGAAWEELDASRVLLDSEQLRMKAEIRPRMSSEAHCRRLMGDAFTVRTAGTCPDGAELTLDSNALFENLGDRTVLKVWRTRSQLKTLGLLPPNDDDGVDEMAWLDMGSADPTQPSNLTDSEAFSALGYEFRGKATQDETKTLDSTPPNAQPSESFFKAAGCEVVTAEYCGFTSPKRQIMNQADIFYYSGHGLFIDGSLQNSSNPTTYGFLPSMAIGKWSHGLKCAVFAGCSILNIGDFRSHSFLRWKTKTRYWFRKKQSYNDGSPGISWENVGPQYLLGYCWTAPLDSQGAPGIVTAFINNLKNGMSKIDAWRDANNNSFSFNACAIDVSSIQHKFWYWDETSGIPVWTNAVKGVHSW